MSLNQRLMKVERFNGRLKAHLHNESDDSRQERLVGQVVVEHGTLPMDELYFELKDMARNRGETDSAVMMAGRLENPVANLEGRFVLFRVGARYPAATSIR